MVQKLLSRTLNAHNAQCQLDNNIEASAVENKVPGGSLHLLSHLSFDISAKKHVPGSNLCKSRVKAPRVPSDEGTFFLAGSCGNSSDGYTH